MMPDAQTASPMRKPLALAGLAIGTGALLLQLALTLPAGLAVGRSLFNSLIFYLSFFTILTNGLALLVYAADLSATPRLGWFRRRRTAGMVVTALTFVMIFYHLLLLGQWEPEGLWLVCDIALHYVAPILFLVFWAVFLADGTLRYRDLGAWLIYPVLYIGYAMIRGVLTADYPYPFLDPGPQGWDPVLWGIVGLFFAFVVLSLLTVTFDKIKPRLARKPDRYGL